MSSGWADALTRI